MLPNRALTPRPILAALTEWWMIPSLRSGPSQCLLPGVPQATSSTLQGAVLISVVTRVELEGGVYREPAQAPRRARFDAMLSAIPGLAFDDLAAKTYGAIVASAGYSRRKLLDRMITAQAPVHRATLVTFNPDDFSGCPWSLVAGVAIEVAEEVPCQAASA